MADYHAPKTEHDYPIRPKKKHDGFYSTGRNDSQPYRGSGEAEVTPQYGQGAVSNPTSNYVPADQQIDNRYAEADKAWQAWPYSDDEYHRDGHTYRGEALGPEVQTEGKLVKHKKK